MISLRLRAPKGNISLSTLSLNSSFSELTLEISKLTKISENYLIIKHGYPPKALENTRDDITLSFLNITDGDTLIVEESKTPVRRMNSPLKKSEEKKEQEATGSDQKRNNISSKNTSSLPKYQTPDKNGLIMIRRIIPADNSCLFNSVIYALECQSDFKSSPMELRNIVASYVLSDPTTYDETILERPNQKYLEWILKEESWGGEVELSILSKHFKILINVIDIRSLEILQYGDRTSSFKNIFLLFDGIHYDVIIRNITEEMEKNLDIGTFQINDEFAKHGALVIANELRESQQFTDLSNFSLMCGVCRKGLKGEKEAVDHGKKTGHSNFQEVKK